MKDKFKELEKPVDKPEDIKPIPGRGYHAAELDGIVLNGRKLTPEEVAEFKKKWEKLHHGQLRSVLGKPTWMERARNLLAGASTFDFLRHFLIGFVGIGGTAIATTGNLGWAVIAGVAGGLVEGGRKLWSGSTASKNGGSKNRIVGALLQLAVAILDMWISKRKEGEDD